MGKGKTAQEKREASKAHRPDHMVWNDRSHRRKNRRARHLNWRMKGTSTVKRALGTVTRLKTRSTRQEELLRGALIAKDVLFDFQKPIICRSTGKFRIADFYFPRGRELSLIIEIDGTSHEGREAYDEEREAWIRSMTGAQIRRFTNEEVEADVMAVVNQICQWGVLYK